ncbi:MAG TPA: hypothetical protein VNN74_01820 [Candidatus Micrarchaeia archaeon]|nr:hypothetical protein [Candidatus Micrarchaeia archaeon]
MGRDRRRTTGDGLRRRAARLLRRALPTTTVLRVGLAAMWGVDAGLQIQPAMFTRAFPGTVLYANAIMYQPGWLAAGLTRAVDLVAPHLTALDAGTAGLEIAIAAGILLRRTRRLALTISIAWALVVWVVGEGLGGMATGTALLEAGAPGAALGYVVVALLVWPGRRPGPGSAAAAGRLGDRGARWLWSGYWALGALLHLQPRFPVGAVLAYNLQTAAQDQQGPLAGLDYRLAQLGDAHGVAVALGLGLCELAIAAAVWSPRLRPTALAAGSVATLLFWVVGQAMGGALTGLSTDLSTAPMVLLVTVALIPTTGGRIRAAAPNLPTGADREPATGDSAGRAGVLSSPPG